MGDLASLDRLIKNIDPLGPGRARLSATLTRLTGLTEAGAQTLPAKP